MSQVHFSRSIIRQDGIENSSLQVREESGLAQEVSGEEEAETNRTTGDFEQSDQGRAKRNGSKEDRTLAHEAIKIYRDTFKLCPRIGFREDIIATVTDLTLWQTVLAEWKERKWSPFKISWMLSEYERREKHTKRSNGTVSSKREGNERPMQARIPKRSGWHLQCMPENEGVRFRASSKTLEQIVAEALREQKDRY